MLTPRHLLPEEELESLSMAGKPKLHYFNGQGRMESIRWLLAAAGVEFEEELFEAREEFEKLIQALFAVAKIWEQPKCPLTDEWIKKKRHRDVSGKGEPVEIDMYVEAFKDLSDMIMFFPLSLPGVKAMNLEYILERATTRFFPVYEKALRDHGQDFLVGNQLSWADVQLLEVILMAEECKPSVLTGFPLCYRQCSPNNSQELQEE
uniref:Glutathione S-transferase n=1 Tax=Felis catus TaxID=9685 RepID=A0ABI7YFQ4_FELCA